ncbi:MAG: hypothetical protein QY307_04415 [Acidimicrobiia bacterium]|nr:MAG: hypothetical protein QY307_04415 [Acidimicrobiia bacterium]
MTTPELQRIIESASQAGVDLDPAEAAQWLEAVTTPTGDEVTLDHRDGVFGHRIAMLDFSADDLAYFRQVGALVEIPDEEGVVETALALSGSAAQSKIQTYPGDADFFERVNVIAPTREQACAILARVMRAKALATMHGPTHRFIEVKFGQYPADVLRNGDMMRKGTPIAWLADEVVRGEIEAATPEGAPVVIAWDEVAIEPGWCKLDWIVADPVRKQVANASNMLDVTWEAPDGTITPLDGYLDPYFQEVYLNTDEVPLFKKLSQHVSADALDHYVAQLEKEVRKYLDPDHANVGKAAKRMYNIFRLDGRYVEAAFLREIFDEPATVLYQLYALVRSIEEASGPGSQVDPKTVIDQTDRALIEVIRALEGVEEEELVGQLLRIRDGVTAERGVDTAVVEEARDLLLNLVNNFFYEKMTAMPEVRTYMESVQD